MNRKIEIVLAVAMVVIGTTAMVLVLSSRSEVKAHWDAYYESRQQETPAMIEWPHIVTIKQGSGQGTGFMVGPELVVTAAHAISMDPHVIYQGITLSGGPILANGRTAKVVKIDRILDISLLKVLGLNGTVAQFDDVTLSEDVWLVGDVPRLSSTERIVHKGYVSDMDFDPTGRVLIGGASIMPGMSGCPIMNTHGSVVGMVIAVVLTDGCPNYGNVLVVPANDLVSFIEEDLNAVRQADPAREGVTPCRPDGVGVAIPGPGCATVPPMAY